MATKRAAINNIINKDMDNRNFSFDNLPKNKSVPVTARIAVIDRNRLKAHFTKKGLPLSSGIKMIIRDYIEDNKI